MENIWQEENDYGKLEPLTDKIIEIAEEKLKVSLPKSYINILKQQNGGYIKFNAHRLDTPTSWADDHINVDHIFGIGLGKEKGILDSEYLIKEWDLPENVVLISGDGHSWIALDYRSRKTEPPVILIDVDEEQMIELAPNFDTFLNGLYEQTTEFEEEYTDDIQRQWTIPEINDTFSANNELEIAYALDYLSSNATEQKQFIEQSLIKLLQHSKLEIRETAANYAYHFYENGILSTKCVESIVKILRNDHEIEYFAHMYFAEL
nr:SMI1/KNR4 family protein [Salipaludibacillus keqinensis]